MSRLKKEAEKRFGFTAIVGASKRWFPKTNHYRILLTDVRFKGTNKLFRDHIWLPLKHFTDYEEGDVVYFTAEINPYRGSNGTNAELVKIKVKGSEDAA